jgi:hypothetical protein
MARARERFGMLPRAGQVQGPGTVLQARECSHARILDAFNAASGAPLVRRPLSVDAGTAVTNITSAGVAIAEHEVFAAAGGLSYETAPGYVIAYRAG